MGGKFELRLKMTGNQISRENEIVVMSEEIFERPKVRKLALKLHFQVRNIYYYKITKRTK